MLLHDSQNCESWMSSPEAQEYPKILAVDLYTWYTLIQAAVVDIS